MSFYCEFRTTMSEKAGEPSDFISKYSGDLFAPRLPDRNDDFELAGRVRLCVLNAEAAEQANVSLYDVLDEDAATEPYIQLLDHEEGGNFNPAVRRLLNEDFAMSRNMLLLDRLEILPQFRRQQLGLRFMRSCIAEFGIGCRIAALKPFPLQFEAGIRDSQDAWTKRLDLTTFSSQKRMSTMKLKNYYARERFMVVRGTNLMVRDLYAA